MNTQNYFPKTKQIDTLYIACSASDPIADYYNAQEQHLLWVSVSTWVGNSTRSPNWSDDITIYLKNNETELYYVYDAINSTFIVGRGTKIAVEMSSYDGNAFDVANFTFGEVEVIGTAISAASRNYVTAIVQILLLYNIYACF